MSPMPFDADESVDDDLRNIVWKGHYLGYGPADVMMHVPVAKALIDENDRALIFAPYYREKLQVSRRVDKIPRLNGMLSLEGHLVGTEDASLGSSVLLTFGGGRLRELVRHYKSTSAAVADMKAGKLAAVVGQRSELRRLLWAPRTSKFPMRSRRAFRPMVGYSACRSRRATSRWLRLWSSVVHLFPDIEAASLPDVSTRK